MDVYDLSDPLVAFKLLAVDASSIQTSYQNQFECTWHDHSDTEWRVQCKNKMGSTCHVIQLWFEIKLFFNQITCFLVSVNTARNLWIQDNSIPTKSFVRISGFSSIKILCCKLVFTRIHFDSRKSAGDYLCANGFSDSTPE